MNLRTKLSYTAIGGLLMLIGMLASSVFMPNLIAQKDKFGDIECTSLTVVDASTGHQEIILGGRFGAIECMSLAVVDANGRTEILLVDRVVHVADKGGKSKVRLSVDEHGGRVVVRGKDESATVMGFNESGNGTITTWYKDGNRQ